MAEKIPSSEIDNLIKDLDGWRKTDGRDAIEKSFKFKDFKAAFAFMTACADYAETINHHPEWFNVYNRIDVVLSTHDVGGLSVLDIETARKMNEVFSNSAV